MPGKYDEAQFIAFCIRPGSKIVNGRMKYLGDDDASKTPAQRDKDDLEMRCKIMKAAVRTAYNRLREQVLADTHAVLRPARAASEAIKDQLRGSENSIARGVSNAIDSSSVLKVFMAPEFYFRGASGAYPVEIVSDIMPKLRQEIDDPKYKDWLFVFGTAIGEFPPNTLGPASTQDTFDGEVLAVFDDPDTGNKLVVIEDPPHLLWAEADIEEVIVSSVDEVRLEKNGVVQITLDRARPEYSVGKKVTFVSPDQQDGRGPLTITASSTETKKDTTSTMGVVQQTARQVTRITVTCPPEDPCPRCGCLAHSPHPGKPLFCKDCNHTHEPIERDWLAVTPGQSAKVERVLALNPPGSNKYALLLNSNAAFGVGNVVTLTQSPEPPAVEILNYALVRKGGPEAADKKIREALIYKEYVSPIDFVSPYRGKFDEFHDPSGKGRLIVVGDRLRQVLPSAGSRDMLSSKTNEPGQKVYWKDSKNVWHDKMISEVMKGYIGGGSALGGGSVFTIDDITFGLEVCLDHAKNRLARFYYYICPACRDLASTYNAAGNCPRCGTALARAAASSDPAVQVQLIPSWGMSIDQGDICCLPKGPVFNVDGARPTASEPDPPHELQIADGTYRCQRHPAQKTTAPAMCADPGGDFSTCNCPGVRYGPDVPSDPNFAGWTCATCNAGLRVVSDRLKPAGAKQAHVNPIADVDLTTDAPTWKKYFDGTAGARVVIYAPVPIPAAKTVAEM